MTDKVHIPLVDPKTGIPNGCIWVVSRETYKKLLRLSEQKNQG